MIHGRRIRIEHWDVALNQGEYVGRPGPARRTAPYDVVPYFFSDLGRLDVDGVRRARRAAAVDVRGSMADDDFVAYYTDDGDGKLTACLGVNRSDEVKRPRS